MCSLAIYEVFILVLFRIVIAKCPVLSGFRCGCDTSAVSTDGAGGAFVSLLLSSWE